MKWKLLGGLAAGLAVVLTVGAVEAWVAKQQPPPGSVTRLPERPNIVLITLCSVRADRTSLVDPELTTTPALQALAEHGVVFDHAFANATFTLGAHASILTGRLPANIGMADVRSQLEPGVPTLAEVASAHDYRTLGLTAVVAGASFRAGTGLERGFQRFVEGYSEDTTPARLVSWLQEEDSPGLALVHLKQAHSPYGLDLPVSPPPSGPYPVPGVHSDPRIDQLFTTLTGSTYLSRADVEQINRNFIAEMERDPTLYRAFLELYDTAVGRADAAVGAIVKELEAAGLTANTVLVVVGGHGDCVGEEGRLGHQGQMTDYVLHVPFVIAPPGWNGGTRRVDTDVSQVDIMPTILELIGAQPTAVQDGRSLAGTLLGEELAPLPVVSQALSRSGMDGHFRGVETVTYGPNRLVYSSSGNGDAWYFERRARKGGWLRDDDLDEEMADSLLAWRAAASKRGIRTERAPMTEDERQELQRNGYW